VICDEWSGGFFGEVEIFMILLLPKPIAFRLIHTGAIGVILCCFFFTLFLFFFFGNIPDVGRWVSDFWRDEMDGSHEVTKAINAAMWGRYAFLETTLHGGGASQPAGTVLRMYGGGAF